MTRAVLALSATCMLAACASGGGKSADDVSIVKLPSGALWAVGYRGDDGGNAY
jgi:hypothetical protein